MQSRHLAIGLLCGVLVFASSAGCAVRSPTAMRSGAAPQRLVAIARVFEGQGHLRNAEHMYREALVRDPFCQPALDGIAQIAALNQTRSFNLASSHSARQKNRTQNTERVPRAGGLETLVPSPSVAPIQELASASFGLSADDSVPDDSPSVNVLTVDTHSDDISTIDTPPEDLLTDELPAAKSTVAKTQPVELPVAQLSAEEMAAIVQLGPLPEAPYEESAAVEYYELPEELPQKLPVAGLSAGELAAIVQLGPLPEAPYEEPAAVEYYERPEELPRKLPVAEPSTDETVAIVQLDSLPEAPYEEPAAVGYYELPEELPQKLPVAEPFADETAAIVQLDPLAELFYEESVGREYYELPQELPVDEPSANEIAAIVQLDPLPESLDEESVAVEYYELPQELSEIGAPVVAYLSPEVTGTRLIAATESDIRVPSGRDTMADWLIAPAEHVESLLAALSDGDNPEQRALAATLLAEAPADDARVNFVLEHHCAGNDAIISAAAAESLLARGCTSESAVQAILVLAEHPDLEIRNQVCSCMRFLVGTPWESEAVQMLSDRLDDLNPAVRSMAALTLGDFDAESDAIMKRLIDRYAVETVRSVRVTLELAAERLGTLSEDDNTAESVGS